MLNYPLINKIIKLNLEEVKWSEVRDTVYNINPELAEKCDNLNKTNKCSLFKISYPYGAYIVNKGEFYIPTIEGEMIPLKDERIPESLRKRLMYTYIPLSLIIHNSNEVFVNVLNRVIPLNFLVPGELFGLFELMNLLTQDSELDTPIWNVSAGARSAFMLPGISDTARHARIKKRLGTNINLPSGLWDHWQAFVNINTHSYNTNPWHNTILVFPNEWFKDQDNIGYIEFYKYLINQCWKQFQLLEDFTEFSLLWQFFSHAINKRNLKPKQYLIDTVKHLILIAKGSSIAFKPATDDTALPKSLLQQIYVEDYALKDYIPNIMHPAKLTHDSKAYYSLSFPTLLDSSPYSKNPSSIIEDQREIKNLLDILINTIHQMKGSNINSLKKLKFELIHSSNDPFGQIISSKTIPISDPRFLEYNYNNNEERRIFCSSSSFFNGCISISYELEE